MALDLSSHLALLMALDLSSHPALLLMDLVPSSLRVPRLTVPALSSHPAPLLMDLVPSSHPALARTVVLAALQALVRTAALSAPLAAAADITVALRPHHPDITVNLRLHPQGTMVALLHHLRITSTVRHQSPLLPQSRRSMSTLRSLSHHMLQPAQ